MPIPVANGSDDDLENSDLDYKLTLSETEVELLGESSDENESETFEEEKDQSNKEIEFNLQIDREWEIPEDS